MSETKHEELVLIARRMLSSGEYGGPRCSVVLTEMASGSRETPDAIGWDSQNSVLIECKASRADFLADGKKSFRRHPKKGVGDKRFFLAPKDLIRAEELPRDWGLIEVEGTRVCNFLPCQRLPVDKREETLMLLSVLRRLKVPVGRHVKIRAYQIDDGEEPRATLSLQGCGDSDE